MRVAMDQNRSRGMRDHAGLIKNMTVRDDERAAVSIHHDVIRHDGEFQHHLIHFGITVSANRDDVILMRIEKCRQAFGGIAFRKIIACAVVQKVAEQDQLFRLFLFIAFKYLLTVIK